VLAIQFKLTGPETFRGCVHVVPPSVDEMKPTVNWHVLVLHEATG
jgi:hypothetical protein